MELELKHIIPYISYKLKAEMIDFESDYVGLRTDLIVGIVQWSHDGKLWSVLTQWGSKPAIDRIKPILRPMSTLVEYETEDEVSVFKQLSLRSKSDWDNGTPTVLKWAYDDIQILLEHHFDIFNLISQGLAIDINTLK